MTNENDNIQTPMNESEREVWESAGASFTPLTIRGKTRLWFRRFRPKFLFYTLGLRKVVPYD